MLITISRSKKPRCSYSIILDSFLIDNDNISFIYNDTGYCFHFDFLSYVNGEFELFVSSNVFDDINLLFWGNE